MLQVRPLAHIVNVPYGEGAMPGVTEGKSQPEWDLDCPRKELTQTPLPSLPLPRFADRLDVFFWPQTRAGHFTVFSLVKYSTSSQVNVTVPIPQMEKWRLRKPRPEFLAVTGSQYTNSDSCV